MGNDRRLQFLVADEPCRALDAAWPHGQWCGSLQWPVRRLAPPWVPVPGRWRPGSQTHDPDPQSLGLVSLVLPMWFVLISERASAGYVLQFEASGP